MRVWAVQPRGGKSQGYLINVCKYLKGGNEDIRDIQKTS